ncbi:hypothetical protein GCG54_00001618 [Colletotrichum gloeosporioides]|uniref:Kelch repeat protein n=1 Tax=Colletotrichum gloeosporioides TaxID=474922 RepID=A0A8H4CWW6_COLGL|nr:uncharacterized protein GCG54_00001618 [Colletotrichum gloeosporioides]KAF3811302.1 hypothetical protein GCG54_00001618 [Colletotrichum gloeosporioides]
MRLATCLGPWLAAEAHCLSLFRGPGLIARQDTPSASNFLRRSFSSAAVLGDYVYIDGGRISQIPFTNASSDDLGDIFREVNSTISISLKESWSTSKIDMRSITKNSQKLDSQSIWLGPSGKEFYTWAGEKIYNRKLPDKDVWRFTADGSGGGKWERVTPSNPITFQNLLRPTDGTYTQSKDTGYYFGGIVRRRSDYSISDWNVSIPTPGLVSYNMTSGEIKNTTSEFGQYGTFKEGSSQFLPFGDAGILLFLGGLEAPRTSRGGDWKEVDFTRVTLFDIEGQRWYTQGTTGSIPATRRRFCTTGISGPNNTFEIFMYGGFGSQGVLSDVYVLTVPGFNFFKASGYSTPRFDQACVAAGRGQVLSIGGLAKIVPREGWTDPDPWPNGLGVFDMTEMRWKDGYEADDAAYEPSKIVKQWYNEGGRDNVSWRFYSRTLQNISTSPGPTSTPGGNDTASDGEEKHSSSPSAGAIAGGVVGGVFGMALLTGLAFFLIKRKKKYAATPQQPPHDPPNEDSVYQKYGSQSTAYGGQNTHEPHQLHGESSHLEMDGSSAPAEVHGCSGPVELPAETTVNGNYVYIDGGEISWMINGTNALTDDRPSRSVNLTLSIDLQSSWSTSDVRIKVSDKDNVIPKLNFQAIWRDPDSKGFYIWGGETPYNDTVKPSNIFHFDANESGKGSWKDVVADNVDDFNKFKQPKGGAFAQSKDMAYYFGGLATPRTDSSIPEGKFVALTDLVTFNMTSKRVTKTSPAGFGEHRTFRYGSMEAIPFGSQGLLLVLGGSQAPPSASSDEDWVLMDFKQVHLYDIKAGRWYQQQTTGDWPTARENFCTVGVDGPNNTFDIFMYGGMGNDGISNEVYVLTLPGFHFFKANPSSTIELTPRMNHACVLVGRRQMLSIGGSNHEHSFKVWANRDPWTRGLGIFDMMQWTWRDQYYATAAKYTGPEEIRQWYEGGGMDKVNWADDELKSLFALKPTSEPTSNTSPNEDSKPSIGAIVGAVVGGVVGLILIMGIVLFFLKRKKRKADHVSNDVAVNPPAYEKRGSEIQQAPGSEYTALRGSAIPDVHEMSGDLTAFELPGDHGTSERNDSNSRNEVSG